MARDRATVDIAAMPDVARLAREVAVTGRVCVLRDGDTELAILSPAPRSRRRTVKAVSDADIAAALAASWVGLVDADTLKSRLDAARGDSRPPPTL